MKMWYVYTVEYSEAARNDAVRKFVEPRLELKDLLSEVSQKKDKHRFIAIICDIYRKLKEEMNLKGGMPRSLFTWRIEKD